MNIFSEIYGTYFRITADILSRGTLSEKEAKDIISEKGFSDTALFISEKLFPDKLGNSMWNLLRKNDDGTLSSVLQNTPPKFITMLQKRWLKLVMKDPRIKLFLDDENYDRLSKKLADIQPLCNPKIFRVFDAYSDGDDYSSEAYQKNFRTLVDAIKEKRYVEISFSAPKSGEKHGVYLPLKLEYSAKNDKFRALCVLFSNSKDRPVCKTTVNLGRITSLALTDKVHEKEVNMQKYHAKTRCNVPVTVEVSAERNGIERFMTEFASYEKRSFYNPNDGKCTVQIWYDKQDETELLIQLLSFGAVVEIKSPASFRREAQIRVERQYELFFGKQSDFAAALEKNSGL